MSEMSIGAVASEPDEVADIAALEVHHELSRTIAPRVMFNREQIELVKRTIAKDATDDELALFIAQAQRTGLDPFSKQIYAIKRGGKMSIQVAIDGFRLIAERTGVYRGQLGPYWCGADGEWRDSWLDATPPAAAKVGVLRADWDEPLWSVARFGAYKQDTPIWTKMPEVMLAKCAESLALRRAFPSELSGLYTSDEMGQAETVLIDQPTSEHAGGMADPVDPERERRNAALRSFKERLAEFPEQAQHAAELARRLGVPTLADASAVEIEDVHQAFEAFVATGEMPPESPEHGESGDSGPSEPEPGPESLSDRLAALAVSVAEGDPDRSLVLNDVAEWASDLGWDDAAVRKIIGSKKRDIAKALGEIEDEDLATAAEMLEAAHDAAVPSGSDDRPF